MEGPIVLSIHGLTLGGIVLILGLLLKQHKVWIRMKDRVNSMWRKHCHDNNEYFEPLENGRH